MFTIEVASLEAGLHQLALEPRAEDLGLDPEKFKDVHVDAQLDVTDRRIHVVLDARAVAALECDRTLRRFDQEIGGRHHVVFAPPEFAEEGGDAHDDIRPLDAFDKDIDVTDVVRDTILLAIPQRCIAPGAEEEEIPTAFGAPEDDGEDIDPRWEALRKLTSGASSN